MLRWRRGLGQILDVLAAMFNEQMRTKQAAMLAGWLQVALAIKAVAVDEHPRGNHAVAWFDGSHALSDFLDNTDELVTQPHTWFQAKLRTILRKFKVRAANSGKGHADNGVARLQQFRFRQFADLYFCTPVIVSRFHCRYPSFLGD